MLRHADTNLIFYSYFAKIVCKEGDFMSYEECVGCGEDYRVDSDELRLLNEGLLDAICSTCLDIIYA